MPKQIILNNNKYIISKVYEFKDFASLRVGGIGVRYLVKINTQQTFLFYDKIVNKWFVEYKK